jgi:endoglucanase
MQMLDILEKLSAIPGVSGWEDSVREAITAMIDGHCEYEVDALGNLIAYKTGKSRAKQTILLSAHMDEVGLIITMIEDSGLLRFATVGGIDSRVIAGKAVKVGASGVAGVIGRVPVHLQKEDEREKPASPDKLYIDIGAKDKSEAEEYVRVGDRVVFCSQFRRLGGEKIIGRAFDDRAGCAILIDMICSDLAYDCVFSFTVQEEIGCIGAFTAAYRTAPDIAIAVETTTAADIAGVPADKQVCALGKGPVISFMDRGAIYDHGLYHQALDTAKEQGIPCQIKQVVAGANESRSLQITRTGSRVLAVSLPCRYLHTPSNMLAVEDIAHMRRLLEALVEAFAGN